MCVQLLFLAQGCVEHGGQRSSSALSLHSKNSKNNTLPAVSWQPGCLAQQSTAGADPQGLRLALCPRTSSGREVLARWSLLSQHLHEDQGTGSPRHAQGDGWRGLEIRQQTQHGGVGRGDPLPSPLKWPGPAGQHCPAMERTTVLITGCSSGIGLGLAARLAGDTTRRFKGKGSMLPRGSNSPRWSLGWTRQHLTKENGAWGWAGVGAGHAAWWHCCPWPHSLPSLCHHA